MMPTGFLQRLWNVGQELFSILILFWRKPFPRSEVASFPALSRMPPQLTQLEPGN